MAKTELKLAVEMVPKPLWDLNARKVLTSSEWDTLRRHTYREAGHRCEVCSGQGHAHPVEAHEVWRYDDVNLIQTLERLVALCPNCHKAVHYGQADMIGMARVAQGHLKDVNGWTEQQLHEHLAAAFDLWVDRSMHENWQVDFTWLVEKHRELTGKIPRFFQEAV
jgi:hypothetical protein